jgi:hypothetical protein
MRKKIDRTDDRKRRDDGGDPRATMRVKRRKRTPNGHGERIQARRNSISGCRPRHAWRRSASVGWR